MNINKIILSGKLTSDPIIKNLNSGNNVLTFNLETVQEFQTQTGIKKTINFIDCVAWGKTAESCTKLHKDSQVIVEGQISIDSFTSQSGDKRTKHKVTIQNILFLNSNPKLEQKEKVSEEQELPY